MGSTFTSGGVSLHFEEEGSGPALVLVHGGLVDCRSWERQRSLASELRLIMPDTRGFGQSTGPLTGLRVHDLADDVIRLLDHLGVESSYLLGFSMGGMTVQACALLHPERVRGIILVSTRCGGLPLRAANRGPEEVPGHVRRAFSPSFLQGNEEFLERYIAMAVENESKGWYDVRQAMTHAFDADQIGSIACPALVIHARDDASIPVVEAERLSAALASARLVVVEDSGHTIQIERPELFNELVVNFVATSGLEPTAREGAAQ
jgi:3-oxoadipate enol-lactonase